MARAIDVLVARNGEKAARVQDVHVADLVLELDVEDCDIEQEPLAGAPARAELELPGALWVERVEIEHAARVAGCGQLEQHARLDRIARVAVELGAGDDAPDRAQRDALRRQELEDLDVAEAVGVLERKAVEQHVHAARVEVVAQARSADRDLRLLAGAARAHVDARNRLEHVFERGLPRALDALLGDQRDTPRCAPDRLEGLLGALVALGLEPATPHDHGFEHRRLVAGRRLRLLTRQLRRGEIHDRERDQRGARHAHGNSCPHRRNERSHVPRGGRNGRAAPARRARAIPGSRSGG